MGRSQPDEYGRFESEYAHEEEKADLEERDRKIAALKEEKPKVDKVTDAKIEAAAKAIRDLYESLQAPEDATPRQLAKVALEAAAKVEE